jgi:Fibronectin type III domain
MGRRPARSCAIGLASRRAWWCWASPSPAAKGWRTRPTPTRPLAAEPRQRTPLNPSCSEEPRTRVTVGDPYYYAPTVSQGSDPISFSIQGQPAWTSFDSQTGALAGTPTAGDVGLSGGITITAVNSVNTVAVGPFSIGVDSTANPGPATGSATLNWSPPTENTDGTPLTNLAGYYVHYGTSDASLAWTIDVADASAATYVVRGLTPGTYYFAVSAYNSLGLEGAWSNLASKTL